MKKYLSALLILSSFTSCGKVVTTTESSSGNDTTNSTSIESSISSIAVSSETDSLNNIDIEETTTSLSLEEMEQLAYPDYAEPEFNNYSDQAFTDYIVDNLHSGMEADLSDEDYIIESISATYIPQEYIDELYNNSQSNIYFGYTEEEVNKIMGGKKCVFTLDREKGTIIEEQQLFDNDVYRKMLTNVAIGSGVILVCVVVTIVTEGSDIPAVAAICAISGSAANYGATTAIGSGALSALISGAYKYYKTGDMDEALLAAGTQGSEAFKWGAIFGAVEGGLIGAFNFFNAPEPSWIESEKFAAKKYNGSEQKTFLDGVEVAYGTEGATRPDVICELSDGTLEAIEVKNYDLSNPNNVNNLVATLKKEIGDRVINLPEGSTQKIMIDVRGKGYSNEIINFTKWKIWKGLEDIYPYIPIDFVFA